MFNSDGHARPFDVLCVSKQRSGQELVLTDFHTIGGNKKISVGLLHYYLFTVAQHRDVAVLPTRIHMYVAQYCNSNANDRARVEMWLESPDHDDSFLKECRTKSAIVGFISKNRSHWILVVSMKLVVDEIVVRT